MHPHIVWNYYEDLSGRIVGKRLHSGYTFFMNDGGFWELSVNPAFERIEEPFRISPDIEAIPAGSYGWAEYQIRLQRTHGDLDIPDDEFTRTFWTFRANYSFNTNMFVDALVQYDPGSELMNTN